MSDEIAPYLDLPLRFENGRLATTDLAGSIEANIRLILHNQVQAIAKPDGVPAVPEYGANLPHHEFRHGRVQDVVRTVRVALKNLEPRLAVSEINFVRDQPGRYLPFAVIRVIGEIVATGEKHKFEFEIQE